MTGREGGCVAGYLVPTKSLATEVQSVGKNRRYGRTVLLDWAWEGPAELWF